MRESCNLTLASEQETDARSEAGKKTFFEESDHCTQSDFYSSLSKQEMSIKNSGE